MTSVSVFGIRYFCRYFFYVCSVFGIGILKYRDIGIGIRYFVIIYNFWCNTATTMHVGSCHVHVGLWITLQTTPLISCEPHNAGATCQVLCQISTCPVPIWPIMCWWDVKPYSIISTCPIIYTQLDHSHGPPRTARTNLGGRATTCMRYILSQQKCTCSCPAAC